MNTTKQLKIGSVLSYAQMALGVIVSLVYVPIMTRLLGKSEYGLYNTVMSTVSMLSILSLGFSSSYVRYFSKYKAKNDRDSISRLNGLFLIIFTIIGVVAFLCGMFLTFNLNLVFDKGLTSAEYGIARVLMLLLTVNLSFSFIMSVFTSIVSANERFIFLKLLGMLKTVGGPLVTLPLLLMGFRSIAMVTVTVCITLITDLVYAFYVIFKLKERFVFRGIEKGLFKSLFVYTSFIAVNIVVDQINLNIAKVLLGRFCGTEVVAVYAVGYSLYTYYMMFSTSVSSVFAPRIHHIVNATRGKLSLQKEQLTQLFTKVGRIQFLILMLISTGLLFFGKDFIVKYWVGEGYDDAYYVTIILVFSGTIALIQNLGIEIQRAQNMHKFRSIAYLIMACINLVLCVFLCQIYGAVGATIGTAISLVVANGIIMNIYYHKKCNIDILSFWKSILSMAKGLVLPVTAGVCLMLFVRFDSIWLYLGGILLYVMLYAVSMWFLGMNREEKQLVTTPIKAVLKRLRLIKK